MSLGRICLVVLVLLWSAQSGAAIVKVPGQQTAANGARDSKPDPRKPPPKFVPAPTNHYAQIPRQAWTI